MIDVDGGWDLGSETEQPLTTAAPLAASLATVEPEPAAELDDGWCLSNDAELAPAAEADVDGCREVAGEIISLVAELPEDDGWLPAADEEPLFELSDEERAFFRAGEQLARAPVRVESFDDLDPEPKRGFWQRFWRKAG